MQIKKILKSTSLYKKINAYRWREIKVSLGKENPDKTFYVIRRHADKAGLFSFLVTNIASIKEATDKGYTPVVDMMNSPNPMITKSEVGKINAWDLFFEQPCGYNMTSISHSKNVILGEINPPSNYPDYRILNIPAIIKSWQEYTHKYIKLKPELMQIRDNYISENFASQKVLGILCRGTDYTASKPANHPIQPTITDVLNDARKLIEDNDYKLIYLATEDKSIWEKFNQEFPDKIISYQKHHFSLENGENINVVANQSLSPYERNKEYLISISILAKCNALLAGATSGSIGALLMSDSYEYYHIYQLGTY